jgi:hypothetical protein
MQVFVPLFDLKNIGASYDYIWVLICLFLNDNAEKRCSCSTLVDRDQEPDEEDLDWDGAAFRHFQIHLGGLEGLGLWQVGVQHQRKDGTTEKIPEKNNCFNSSSPCILKQALHKLDHKSIENSYS